MKEKLIKEVGMGEGGRKQQIKWILIGAQITSEGMGMKRE